MTTGTPPKVVSKYPEWVKLPSEQQMHDHFILFAAMIWLHLGLPSLTWIQADISDYLQNGPRRRIIQAFRGVGKSWLTAAYVLWLLYRDPQHKIMVVSASKERADAFSIFVKRLISDVPLLKFLEPREGQRNSNISFDVGPSQPDQSPSVKSVGITGQLTGSRANTIIADDVEIPKNSGTEHQREKLGELVKEFDAIIKPGAEILYLGTPQVEQSLYTELRSRGYETRIWPARFTSGIDAKGIDKYQGCLAPIISAQLASNNDLKLRTTEPARFDDLDLTERELSYGRSGFALQFMLDTSLSDADKYPLKISDLICMDLDKKIAPVQLTYAAGGQQEIEDIPNVGLNGDRLYGPLYVSEDFRPYDGTVMIIDPSGRGQDETAYCVSKELNSMIYITAWGGLKGGYDMPTLEGLATIAKEQGVNMILIESNFGDGMFTALFEPVLARIYGGCSVEEYSVHQQKELRIIDKLEPALNQHRVVIDRKVADKNSTDDELKMNGLYQLSHITKERQSLAKDDRVDVLAECVGYWMDQMKVEAETQEKKHKEKLLMTELREHARVCKAGGHVNRYKERNSKSAGSSWLSRR